MATRYGCVVQGATEVALTGLDVLGYLNRIPICTGYVLDGEVLRVFPTTRQLERVRPVYEYFPGWRTPLHGVERFEDLPRAAQRYVRRIEELLGVPVRYVSHGPRREQLFERAA